MLKIFALAMVLFSGVASADTYNATVTSWKVSGPNVVYNGTEQYVCSHYWQTYYGYTTAYVDTSVSPNQCYAGTGTGHAEIDPYAYSCPYGGTVSGSSCINVPSCTSPAVRDLTAGSSTYGQCITLTVCNAGQYNDGSANGGQCLPIPDCNKTQPSNALGYYFDTTAKACTVNSGAVSCATPPDGTTMYFCTPLNDCKPASFICSTDPAAIATENATRTLQVAASQALATATKAQIDQMDQAAQAAAAQAQNDALTKTQSVSDAAAALAAAKASGDQTAISQAITNYSKALADAADSQARLVNKTAAKTKLDSIDSNATNTTNQIPSANPGNADTYQKDVAAMVPGATTALNDALTGDGNGTGRGSGVSTSTTPSTDTSGLAKDTTMQGIEGTLNGISNELKGTASTSTNDGKGRFYSSTGDTVSSVTATFMTTAKNSPILKAGKDVFDVSFPQMSSCSSCDFSIPSVMGMDAITSQPFCADWMGAFWTFISSALHIGTIYLAARWIVTSAA